MINKNLLYKRYAFSEQYAMDWRTRPMQLALFEC